MRVLARCVKLMLMVSVLDRADLQSATGQFLDEIDNKCRLAMVLTPNNVNAFHVLLSPTCVFGYVLRIVNGLRWASSYGVVCDAGEVSWSVPILSAFCQRAPDGS